MKVIFALFFIGLCGSIYANQALFQELAQIKEHPFGATVLAAITANLQAKAPIDDISSLLQQILADLLSDQSSLNTYYSSTKGNLNSAISQNTATRDNLQGVFNGLVSAIQQDSATKTTKISLRTTVQGQIVTTQNRITQLDTDFARVDAQYVDDLGDVANAIAYCQQALSKMATYRSSTSLIQVSSSAKKEMKTFSDKMESMTTKLSKHGTMYGTLIRELITLTQNTESGKASRIVELLNQLLALLQQAQTDLTNQRASYTSNYNTQRSQAVNELASLNQQESQLTNEINALTQRIAQNIITRDSTEVLLNAVKATLAQNIADLATLESYFAAESPKYERLISIMRTLIDHFNNNISNVDDWTRQQINGF